MCKKMMMVVCVYVCVCINVCVLCMRIDLRCICFITGLDGSARVPCLLAC